jgi:hypothetical protein
LADAGFIFSKAAVLSAAVKERPCTVIHILIIGSIFQGEEMYVLWSRKCGIEMQVTCVSF